MEPDPSDLVSPLSVVGKACMVGSKTVIGHYPAYLKLAKKLNARFFHIPAEVFEKMSVEARWIANRKFLDRAIARGDEIILATPLEEVKPGSYFQKELQYLYEKGLHPSLDGKKMLPMR
jgi:hypothetical protein